MNKDEAREAAWKELRTVPLLFDMDEVMNTVCDPRHRNMQMVRLGFGKGFDAGAASVDRRAIVEEAFSRLDRFIGRDFYGYDDIADVMNEALAEMEANNGEPH